MTSFLASAHCSSVICGLGLGSGLHHFDDGIGVLFRLAQLFFAVEIVFARVHGIVVGQHQGGVEILGVHLKGALGEDHHVVVVALLW